MIDSGEHPPSPKPIPERAPQPVTDIGPDKTPRNTTPDPKAATFFEDVAKGENYSPPGKPATSKAAEAAPFFKDIAGNDTYASPGKAEPVKAPPTLPKIK